MKEKCNTIVLQKLYITVVKPYKPKRHTNRKGRITKWV